MAKTYNMGGYSWVGIPARCIKPPWCPTGYMAWTVNNPGAYAKDETEAKPILLYNQALSKYVLATDAGQQPSLTTEEQAELERWAGEQCSKHPCTAGATTGSAGGDGGAIAPANGGMPVPWYKNEPIPGLPTWALIAAGGVLVLAFLFKRSRGK